MFHNLFSTLWLWFPRRQGHLTNATQHNGYNSINASTLPCQGDSSLPHPNPRRFWAPVLRDHSLQTLLSTVQQLLDAGLIYESRRCLFRALYRVECKQPFHQVQTTFGVSDDDHRVPFRVHGAREKISRQTVGQRTTQNKHQVAKLQQWPEGSLQLIAFM